MPSVAEDFAEIARRLKEIQEEVAKAKAAAEAKRSGGDAAQSEARDVYDDMSACA